MASVRALVFCSLLACILFSSSRAATECDNRKVACEATCEARNATSYFNCDEQSGAISSSCACAMSSSSSATSFSSTASSSTTASSNPTDSPQEITIPAATTCQEKAKLCESSCPENSSAQFDCEEDQAKAASASADSCVCSPTDLSSSITPNPFTTPIPIQRTTIAPSTPGVTDATIGLPATTATTERSATTVVDSAYTNKIWKVSEGRIAESE